MNGRMGWHEPSAGKFKRVHAGEQCRPASFVEVLCCNHSRGLPVLKRQQSSTGGDSSPATGLAYQRVPSSPGITHRPSAATRPITMPSYPVHDELSGSQVLTDVITLSGPHGEPGAGGSALATAVLKLSVSIAAAVTTSVRVASNMIGTSGRWSPTSANATRVVLVGSDDRAGGTTQLPTFYQLGRLVAGPPVRVGQQIAIRR